LVVALSTKTKRVQGSATKARQQVKLKKANEISKADTNGHFPF
jgi:hypothetical protein